ncbi:hypothetical protein V5N11_009474 [Cardamine amara subsp. amara]|uniref:Ubiquitin-like protease family profile domain-containing protein n=1 Tax=Cardamine amara subsp. amara TaxID=228776 RepID=A0ABD1A1S2_CARAN
MKSEFLKNVNDLYVPMNWKNWHRNERAGDCGPVSMKFLEIHAAGLGVEEMAAINDKAVDLFRQKYAMDRCEEVAKTGSDDT